MGYLPGLLAAAPSDNVWLAAIVTASLGLAAAVVGQFIQRLFIEPIQEQKRIIARIATALTAYRAAAGVHKSNADADSNSTSFAALDAAGKALHQLAAELLASTFVVPCYDRVSPLGLVLDREVAKKVVDALLYWGAFSSKEEAGHLRQEIIRLLGIKPSDLPPSMGEPPSR